MAGDRWFQSMYFPLKLGVFQLVMLIFQGGGNSNIVYVQAYTGNDPI